MARSEAISALGHISTTEGLSSETWRTDMRSVPKAMEQDGQLEPSIWKEAGGAASKHGEGSHEGEQSSGPLTKEGHPTNP